MRALLIDDMRNFGMNGIPSPGELGEGVTMRTYQDGIIALTYQGPWDVLYLDHDLGDWSDGHSEKTGYDIMCWLEENDRIFLPKKIVLVTSNPVGRKKMQAVIDRLYGDKDETI